MQGGLYLYTDRDYITKLHLVICIIVSSYYSRAQTLCRGESRADSTALVCSADVGLGSFGHAKNSTSLELISASRREKK